METKITEQKTNELFQRKEIFAVINNKITPTKVEAAEAIAKSMKADIKSVVIERILGNYGSQDFKVEAKIYDSVEARNNVDKSKYVEPKVEAPVEEPKVEAPKEEAPKEEVKEEAKE